MARREALVTRFTGMLTSKAKYALRAMIDLAGQNAVCTEQPVFIADIAERQGIPRRYLENILLELRRHGLVVSFRGKTGGYALSRQPQDISFADVVRAMDGPLALTPCTSKTAYQRCGDCVGEAHCAIRGVLGEVRESIAGILERTTLASVTAQDPA